MNVMGGDHGRHRRRTGEDSENDDSELMVTAGSAIGVPKARHGRLRLMIVPHRMATKKPRPTFRWNRGQSRTPRLGYFFMRLA
jgi:hypothetical protein